MALKGSRFRVVNRIWSHYRIHADSITGSAKADAAIRAHGDEVFTRVIGRTRRPSDRVIGAYLRIGKYLENPTSFVERLSKGPVYGAAAKPTVKAS
jgi:hypothetical protein